jgi:hypothetical protein
MPSYEFAFQVTLVLCAFIVHNFIHVQKRIEDTIDWDDEDSTSSNNTAPANTVPLITDNPAASALRDRIAMEMWRDYELRCTS